MSQLKFVTDGELRAGIRELRLAVGLSQEEFAKRIGKSYGMVQRYEQKRPPVGKALLPLVHLAEEQGRADLADLFRHGMLRELISPEGASEFMTEAALTVLENEQTPLLLDIMDRKVNEDELGLLALWLGYIREMPPVKVQALSFFMQADLTSSPVAERIRDEIDKLASHGIGRKDQGEVKRRDGAKARER